jgi:hypothetical protein
MSPRRAPLALLSLLAASAALGACGSHGERDPRSDERAAVRDAADRAAALATGGAPGDSRPGARLELDVGKTGALVRGGDPPLGAGDVRVVSTDGALVLALVGDTVRMRLGDSVMTKVRRELDEDADSAAGLGGLI